MVRGLFLFFVGFAPFAAAQGVPPLVQSNFANEFVAASSVTWKPGSNGENYEADFIDRGVYRRVSYNSRGLLLFKETSLVPSQLPAAVLSSLEKVYPGHVIEGLRRVEIRERVSVRVVILHGSVRYEVEIDLGGVILTRRKVGRIDKREGPHEHKEKHKVKRKHDDCDEDDD